MSYPEKVPNAAEDQFKLAMCITDASSKILAAKNCSEQEALDIACNLYNGALSKIEHVRSSQKGAIRNHW